MIEVVSVETMRQSDAWTIANKIPSKELMARAGKGIYDSVEWKSPVAVVCGKGNNAGDGYVVADLLYKNGFDCTLIRLTDSFSEDGKYYYDICKQEGIKDLLFDELEPKDLSSFAIIVDCILGTGFSGEVRGNVRDAIEAINASGSYVVSADINSGLNGDTGLGGLYVKSDLTVSIGTFKYGHFKGFAKEAMKNKINVDIGIDIHGTIDYVEEDPA